MENANFSCINPLYIMEAMNIYQEMGYKPLTVPTCIKHEYNSWTLKDKSVNFLYQNDLSFIGSAEQAFIQLYENDKSLHGSYFAITPCHRDEKVIDDTHLNIFLKIELINIGVHKQDLIKDDAMLVFTSLYPNGKFSTEFSGGRDGEEDILLNGIEIGSYGEDTMPSGMQYTYGTGLAEPRFSYAINYKDY